MLGLYKKSGNIIFLGLDNAGKTTLLRRLKDDKMVQPNPTLHAHVEKLTLGNINITAIDIGGHPNVRKTWTNYMPTIDAIVDVEVACSDAAHRCGFDDAILSSLQKV